MQNGKDIWESNSLRILSYNLKIDLRIGEANGKSNIRHKTNFEVEFEKQMEPIEIYKQA